MREHLVIARINQMREGLVFREVANKPFAQDLEHIFERAMEWAEEQLLVKRGAYLISLGLYSRESGADQGVREAVWMLYAEFAEVDVN